MQYFSDYRLSPQGDATVIYPVRDLRDLQENQLSLIDITRYILMAKQTSRAVGNERGKRPQTGTD